MVQPTQYPSHIVDCPGPINISDSPGGNRETKRDSGDNSETISLRPTISLTAYSFEKVVKWQASSPNSPVRKVCAGAAFLPLAILGTIEAIVRGILMVPVWAMSSFCLPEKLSQLKNKHILLLKAIACTLSGSKFSCIFGVASMTNFARICQNKPLENSQTIVDKYDRIRFAEAKLRDC